MANIQQIPAVIPISTTTSGAVVSPDKCELVGIFAPICTGTALTLTAAKTLQDTFVAVKTAADVAVSITISGTAHYIALDPTLYGGLEVFKLVSGSTELAERTFTLVFRKRPV